MVYEHSHRKTERHSILISKINKTLGQKKILKDISFFVKPNTIHAVIGPNGAGKTTLMRIILGLLKQDSGSVDFFNNVDDVSAMLETDYLFETKTAWENLEYFCGFFNLDFERQKNKILQLSKLLKIDDSLDLKTHYFSKGMKRKFTLLVTLLRDTSNILLDEPTSGVDPESRLLIRDLMFKLKTEGKTIIITSHDLAEIQKCSDTISIIQNGNMLDTIENNDSLIDLEELYFHKTRLV
jgi:ABC-2 type transport system ATP-binding protein